MEFPNFCLSYMANVGRLPSTQGCMTHLSWDESGPCMLEMAALCGQDRDLPLPLGMDGEQQK
jgi:hypothetical protein